MVITNAIYFMFRFECPGGRFACGDGSQSLKWSNERVIIGSRFSGLNPQTKILRTNSLRRQPSVYVEPPDMRLVASPRLYEL